MMSRANFIAAVVCALCFLLPRTVRAEPAADDGVALEFYLAESKPAAGLKQAEVVGGKDLIYLHEKPLLTREDIAEARPGRDVDRRPLINLQFSKTGSEKMAKATSENIGMRLAIVINGKVISAPTIRSKISEHAQITGEFSEAEIEKFVQSIRPADQKSP